jgi:kinesin family protein C1
LRFSNGATCVTLYSSDPSFIDAAEKCLNFRVKSSKGFADMKTVKEEARETTNMLKQTVNVLKQSLFRKESLVEKLMQGERDREQSMEGVKMQMESANASAGAAERELESVKAQLSGAKIAAAAAENKLSAVTEEAGAELRNLRESTEWDARRAAEDFEAKELELSSLKGRHAENQETLRAVRADLANAREAASRAERESSALKRDRENGESGFAAERKALEGQIRVKIDEVTAERTKMSKARSEFDEKLRAAQGEVEKLTVQNRMLAAAAEEAAEGGRNVSAELSSKLAAVEGELETATRALSRERLQRDGAESELSKELNAALERGDKLDAKLAVAAAAAASLKEKLLAAQNGAADAKEEADDIDAAKAAALAKLTAELETLSADLRKKEEDIALLGSELASTAETAEKITTALAKEQTERVEEKEVAAAELERVRTEAGECLGRADALLESQAALMADIKEKRARVAKMEEERRTAVESGASSLEEARAQAREDLQATEARHVKDKEEAAAAAAEVLDAAREKAAFEVQTARDGAAASLGAVEAAAEAKIAAAKEAVAAATAAADAAVADVQERAAAAAAEMATALAAVHAATAAAAAEATDQLAEERASGERAKAAHEEAAARLTEEAEKLAADAAKNAAALEEKIAVTEADLAIVRRAKIDADEALSALKRQQEAAAEAMTEAEGKHAELVEQASSAESRVNSVVAQLQSESAEVDRLEKLAAEVKAAAEVASQERETAAKLAAAEREDHISELRALRAATGIGDDGEELEEDPGAPAAAAAEMSGRDASALTARLVKATKAADAAKRVMAEAEEYKRIAEERLLRIQELEQQALDADSVRRALHNQIQELRGNVRVFCRVRPTTSDTACVECPSDGSSVTLARECDRGGSGGEVPPPTAFEFDRVFGPASTQGEVFEEVSQLVQSALDGYKVCLFSYGQTGSGKTHTMLGDLANAGDHRGIIPRAVAKVVEASQANAKKGWTYEMSAAYVEIYNEQVRDLLKAGSGHSDKHSIVHTVAGVTEVSGVQREPVTSVEAAAGLVRRAAAARAVEATQMNAVSSRSHTIFMLYITGEHAASGSRLTGCLNLVDLAGSERVGRSGAEGARLKEACAINKSLSCLGDVFQALANKQSHVPYRNSKLTYLLQPCLGGDGKTLMFVNINPESPSAEESLCSLKFASQVNAVELGGGRGGGAVHVESR